MKFTGLLESEQELEICIPCVKIKVRVARRDVVEDLVIADVGADADVFVEPELQSRGGEATDFQGVFVGPMAVGGRIQARVVEGRAERERCRQVVVEFVARLGSDVVRLQLHVVFRARTHDGELRVAFIEHESEESVDSQGIMPEARDADVQFGAEAFARAEIRVADMDGLNFQLIIIKILIEV